MKRKSNKKQSAKNKSKRSVDSLNTKTKYQLSEIKNKKTVFRLSAFGSLHLVEKRFSYEEKIKQKAKSEEQRAKSKKTVFRLSAFG